jgi:hypothetical protein
MEAKEAKEAKEPRFGEVLDLFRKKLGINEKGLFVNERTWRKILTGWRPTAETFTTIMTHPLQGLGISHVGLVDYFRQMYGYAPLTQQEIVNYRLRGSPSAVSDNRQFSRRAHDVGAKDRQPALIARYPLLANTRDLTWHPNHAVPVGRIRYECRDGRLGAAFDATSYIQVPHRRLLWLTQFSVCAWVYLDRIGGRRRIVEKGVSNSFWLFLLDDCPIVGFYDGKQHYNHLSATNLSQRGWHFVCGTMGNGLLGLFIDGRYDGGREVPPTATPFLNCEPLTIGWKHNGIGLDHLAGAVSDVRLYDRALSSAQVAQLYESTAHSEVEQRKSKSLSAEATTLV